MYLTHRHCAAAYLHVRCQMNKKPKIFLIVILPILTFGAVAVLAGLIEAYSRINNIPKSSIPNLNGFLITLPALFLWLPVALLLSNCVLWVVPQLRRTAENYAAQAKRPNFGESQRQLAKLALAVAAICVPLIVIGFML